ncbi:hypothetical protein QJS04_geneDACA024172 [Acorus gramineus]|uniref:Uncharacterized protein n=1 Tax=Acorus gramineus TaxID=55184 RepID=A0AAV9AMB4_ACOGR|nr:hypothetical protein QJS04_geneDACA024172 [Acorus gramineus]
METITTLNLFLTPFQPSKSFPPSKTPKPPSLRKLPPLITRVSSSSSSNGRNATESDCPVPFDQQPVNEYQSLSSSVPFSWASAELPVYCSRLALTGTAFSLLVGLPVAAFGVHDFRTGVVECVVGAVSAGILAVTLSVLRMYLGWAYVGNRLLSATVEYEETGWYDGQIWVKTPEVLARDRLLGSFSVKPVLNRVKLTLIGLAVSLLISIFLLINIESSKDHYNSNDSGGRTVPGVYNDDSAKLFEPDAFCGEPNIN